VTAALYDGVVRHRRFTPVEHELRQELRYVLVDLDDSPPANLAHQGWSVRRPTPVWFRRTDYLDGTDRPWRDVLAELVGARLGRVPVGPVRLLTQPRVLGWLFNPISIYYLYEADGRTLDAVVFEVTNTPWHERHWYVLDAAQVTGRGEAYPKSFHVSPFLGLDLTYRSRVTVPGERLAVRFELDRPDGAGGSVRVFDADLTASRVYDTAVDDRAGSLRRATQTLRVSLLIYTHALRLWAKGATFHPHPDAVALRDRVANALGRRPRPDPRSTP
jgi:DUF1365 family protein